jgi:hypothetical protein
MEHMLQQQEWFTIPAVFLQMTASQYQTSNTSFTLMAAFNLNGNGSPAGTVVYSNYNGSNASSLLAFFPFAITSGSLSNVYYDAEFNGVQTGNTLGTCTVGAWHLGFVVYNGTNYKVYVDGALMTTVATATYTKGPAGWFVGSEDPGSPTASFFGWLGKAGIWGATALTQAQVSQLTNAFFNPTVSVTPGSSYDQTILAEPTLLNYWPMNETSGTTAFDLKGGANGTYAGSGVTLGQNLGCIGNGAIFDGTAGCMKATPTMPAPSGGFTVEWVAANIYNASTSGLTLVGGFNSSTQDGFNVNTSSNHYGGNAGTGSLAAFNSTNSYALTYSTHLYQMVYTGSVVNFYIDNSLVSTTSITAWTQANFLGFGAYSAGGTAVSFCAGTFGKLAVYSTALTQTQRNNHYQAFEAQPAVSPLNGFTYQDYDTYIAGLSNAWFHFPMNEVVGSSTFTDIINGFTGSYVSTTAPGVAGPCFDGKTACFCTSVAAGTLPTATLTGGPTTNFSFLQWVLLPYNPNNNGNNAYPVFANMSNNTSLTNSFIGTGAYAGSSGGVLDIQIITSSGASVVTATANNIALPGGVWTFMVATWDGTTLRGYINGVPYGTASIAAGGTFTASTKMFFGNYTPGGATTAFLGAIAKISAVKAVLTQSQIATIYNVGRFGHL